MQDNKLFFVAAFLWLLGAILQVTASADEDEPFNLYQQIIEDMKELHASPSLSEEEKSLIEQFEKMPYSDVKFILSDRQRMNRYSRSDVLTLYFNFPSGTEDRDAKIQVFRHHLGLEIGDLSSKIDLFLSFLESDNLSKRVKFQLIDSLTSFFRAYPSYRGHIGLAPIAQKILEEEECPVLRLVALRALLFPKNNTMQEKLRALKLIREQQNLFIRFFLYEQFSGQDGSAFVLKESAEFAREVYIASEEEKYPKKPSWYYYLQDEDFPESVLNDWDAFIKFVEEHEEGFYFCHESGNWRWKASTNEGDNRVNTDIMSE